LDLRTGKKKKSKLKNQYTNRKTKKATSEMGKDACVQDHEGKENLTRGRVESAGPTLALVLNHWKGGGGQRGSRPWVSKKKETKKCQGRLWKKLREGESKNPKASVDTKPGTAKG